MPAITHSGQALTAGELAMAASKACSDAMSVTFGITGLTAARAAVLGPLHTAMPALCCVLQRNHSIMHRRGRHKR